jgi:hypothetical protein
MPPRIISRIDVIVCDPLNPLFKRVEARLGLLGTILPLFDLAFEVRDGVFADWARASHFLRCKAEDLAGGVVSGSERRGLALEIANQLMNKRHLVSLSLRR